MHQVSKFFQMNKQSIEVIFPTGIFAQLILQVPVVSGYEGGVLEVKCQHQSQHFDCTLHSKTQFYATVLYSDCTYTFSPVTAGHKVFLIFDLVWKNSSHLENYKHPVAIKVLKEVRESLAPWGAGQQDNDWDLLVIPTVHCYTPFQLSFDRLKGKDRLVAQALRSVQFLEIHLVSINNADRTVAIDQQNQICSIGEIRNYQTPKDVPCDVLEDWTEVNNQRAEFPDLKLNIPSEVVGSVPESGRCSFFVIWPKCQRMSIICRSGIDNALDFMETAISNGTFVPKFLPESLERVVNFCSKNPTAAWSRFDSQRSCRLLKICETMKAHQEAQNMIQLLSGGLDSGHFVGIPTEEAAVVWARVIEMIGWNSTEQHVLKMLVPSNSGQIGSFARLAVQFLDDGLTSASLAIANQMMSFLLDHLESMDVCAISSCLHLVMRLEQSNETSDRQRLSSLAAKIGTLEVESVAQVLTDVRTRFGSWIKKTPVVLEHFTHLCLRVADGMQSAEDITDDVAAQMLSIYIWLEDVNVLNDFVSRINLAGTENPLTRAICRGISQQFDNGESISKFLREKSADFGTNHQPGPQRGACKAASSQPMAKRIRTDN